MTRSDVERPRTLRPEPPPQQEPSPRAVRRRRSFGSRLREPATAFLFVLPMLALFVVFRFVPIFGAAGMSFTDFRLNGEFEFIGIENYERLFSDPVFFTALQTTLLFGLIYVPLVMVLSLATAMLLHHVVWAKGFFRGALFLPYVTSFVLAGVIWLWVFAADGLINGTFAHWGIPGIPFLSGDQATVLSSLAVVTAWRGFGYSMLILLAGLKNIPEELTEAAILDGATGRQRFFRITLPLLKPVLFFVLVIETIGAFQIFDVVYVMTGGGPARASYSLIYMLYEQGFKFFDFGYAATIGIALFVLVFIVSLIQRRFLDRED
ncbi:carbohydrate ABC transporter permease [Agromyces silvae]|uniref:carbohydrate ABC transporter permease n=1 Tax=Agromyces silvae TaxID=3388266 RepID=UPI00280ACBEC|nr:sugar ABC transporter permease [Agromyces protaetiae]